MGGCHFPGFMVSCCLVRLDVFVEGLVDPICDFSLSVKSELRLDMDLGVMFLQ